MLYFFFFNYKKHYIISIEYTHHGNPTIEAIYHAEGRITETESNGVTDFLYEYSLNPDSDRDHLSNSRVMFADINEDGVIDKNTEILQENNYYPPDSYRERDANGRFTNSTGGG